MMKAIVDAEINTYDIDLINCHATSTETGDKSEINAIINLFGNQKYKDLNNIVADFENFNFETNVDSIDELRLNQLLLSANKSQFGHLLGAAGSVELSLLILSLKNVVLD